MREGAEVIYDDKDMGNYDFQFDHSENPMEVMRTVDKHLRAHGLEIVSHETNADYYAFSIQPVKKD